MSSKYEQGLPQHIHMVGIGGIGLSAIARVLSAWGHEVTGSDLVASAATRALNDLGIRTYVGHAAKQVKGAGMVVISSAVPENNPEIQAAREWGIPVVKRQDLLGRMMAGRRGVAVAGTRQDDHIGHDRPHAGTEPCCRRLLSWAASWAG